MTSISTISKLALLALLLLTACSGINMNRYLQVRELVPGERILNPERAGKAVYDSRSGTMYVMGLEQQIIYFFRSGRNVNSLGGLGGDRDKFLRLSDIALDVDGSILCLDSAAKVIKKFSSDGAYQGEVELKGLSQPEKFCVSGDQSIYIYDAGPQEIICLSSFSGDIAFRFGKFQVQNISDLSCSRELVVAYSRASNTSKIYNSLGAEIRSSEGFWAFDSYSNAYLWDGVGLHYYNRGAIEPVGRQMPTGFGKAPETGATISIDGRYLVFSSLEFCQLYEIVYADQYE
ncbi:MAG: hypothetical protein CVU49_04540 [Candidatus Cloacimonetes bacterium HGW-Cloacimonetes-2]|nr:MAG: hypothetical protein CVU49_04540 [Candidatus Cloacimonetes bacterium HGW-Cloacimonetes-2]